MFEIGNSLREARVRQRLDYAQIELGTKIRSKYIKALEDEQFATLPAQPYVKGFLRTYAEFLGLDGQLYVDEYNSRFVVEGQEDAPPIARRPPSGRARRDRGVERKVVLLALLGIAGLTALVIVAWKFGGGGSQTPIVLTGSTTSASAPSTLRLTGVHGGTYVEVRRGSATGAVLLQATIPTGQSQVLDGSRFWLFVKRSARLRVQLGGKAVALGPARKNLRVLVTPKRTALAGG